MFIGTDEGGRVVAASHGFPCGGTAAMEVVPPDGFALDEARDWRVIDGALVFDPLPAEPEPTDGVDVAALQAEVAELREALDLLLSGVVA